MPTTNIVQRSKKGSKWEEMNMQFQTNKNSFTISVDVAKGTWLLKLLPQLSVNEKSGLTFSDIKKSYTGEGLTDFELFWDNKPITGLYKAGLLRV